MDGRGVFTEDQVGAITDGPVGRVVVDGFLQGQFEVVQSELVGMRVKRSTDDRSCALGYR